MAGSARLSLFAQSGSDAVAFFVMAHRSDSRVQREAEALIRDKVATVVGKHLEPATVEFDTGAAVQVDGAAADESVLVEIFAGQASRGKQM
jgi:hypothetical protein